MAPVSRGAWVLGLSGLLPPLACLLVVASRDGNWMATAAAAELAYAGIILSFLGGIWWGFAMRRTTGQGRLAALSVLPSLAAFFIGMALSIAVNAGAAFEHATLAASVALAASVVATLLVDRRLEVSGEAPAGWTRFRAALSLGLGAITLATGVVIALTVRTVTYI